MQARLSLPGSPPRIEFNQQVAHEPDLHLDSHGQYAKKYQISKNVLCNATEYVMFTGSVTVIHEGQHLDSKRIHTMALNGTNEETLHPGAYVSREVIPKGMSVTKAAELLGIGRPALSNFLNGNAALSQEMALRLNRTFGADREALLDLQAKYDRRDETTNTPVAAGRHAPTLVQITARSIEEWADSAVAREELPALLRRLVCSTGNQLTLVDFPAFDNAQRPGWDGEVELLIPTPWIPTGRSGWEFGCSDRPANKANADYTKRVRAFPSEERCKRTFVFVTPRNWPGKGKWAEEKAAQGDWKDVRAYDASDLEQWLEQSAETQVWFSERLGVPIEGFRSPDMCWSDWADVCEPVLSPSLFSSAEGNIDDFNRWLSAPPERYFIVSADSPDEALAFACHAIREAKSDVDEPGAGALVFDTPEAIRRFRASNTAPRIAIIHDAVVEREIGDLYRGCHVIIMRPANDVDVEPDIRLRLPSRQNLSDALTSMEIDEDRIDRLIRESGRSPAVLRRRLSEVPAIHAPAWAGNPQISRKLLPAALIGAWSKASTADLEVVRRLLRTDDGNEVEDHVMELLILQDSPLWSRGDYRGVVSRIDALFGIASFVTEEDLKRYFVVAEKVLSESDPALDLPVNERWTAAVHGKVRAYSAALRQGIREMLVILAIHGNHLFQNRLGMNLERKVSSLIRKLLTPLTIEILLSQQDDLPDYAEAAADDFLKVIEKDLKTPDPVVFGLLKPVGNSLFEDCPRTGLLWALESLAWKHSTRVSQILAKMARIPIDDNWAHKPLDSLQAIYRFWIPQTAASPEDRVRGLQQLMDHNPDVGWKICVAQFDTGPQTATPAYRPRWRDEAEGSGHGVSHAQIVEFKTKVLSLILQWPNHDHRTLGDLVDRFHGFADEDQSKIWDLVDAWAVSAADDVTKSDLRERVREGMLTRSGMRRSMSDESLARARTAFDLLEPHDPVARNSWLFRDYWIELSADGIEDIENHEDLVRQLRSSAMGDIWSESGFQGVAAVLDNCAVPIDVGVALNVHIADCGARVSFLRQCLSADDLEAEMDLCIRGFLGSIEEEARAIILAKAAQDFASDYIARLYRCAPFCQHTWRLVEGYDQDVQDRYWQSVIPDRARFTKEELSEFIDRMLVAKRPRAAFRFARFDFSKIETPQLQRLLLGLASVDKVPDESHHHQLNSHDISDAMRELSDRVGIDRSEMAKMEFMFIQALSHSEYGTPNLERLLAESPIDFVRILALSFRRRDDGQDPPEWDISNKGNRDDLASAAYRVLMFMSYIPGTGDDDDIDEAYLSRWIAEARRLSAEHGREVAGDHYIGQILARGPGDENGVKPCQAVSVAMEKVGSEEIASGYQIGTINARGVVSRSHEEGGRQERELADMYRNWAALRTPDFPYVGNILDKIAEDYDRQAQREDDRMEIERRLEH